MSEAINNSTLASDTTRAEQYVDKRPTPPYAPCQTPLTRLRIGANARMTPRTACAIARAMGSTRRATMYATTQVQSTTIALAPGLLIGRLGPRR